MIPVREQELIRQRFEQELTSRVRLDYFGQRPSRIYIAGRDECVYCAEVQEMLQELAALSPRIVLTAHEISDERHLATELGVDRPPATVIRGQANRALRFFGIPSAAEFPPFIQGIVDSASTTSQLKPETIRQLRKLRSEVRVQIYVSPTCAYSPAMVRMAQRVALASARVKLDVIEIAEFPTLAQRLGITAVPTAVYGDHLILAGALEEDDFVATIFKAAEGKPLTPLESLELPRGPVTPLPPPEPPQQPSSAPRQTASGLVLPR